MSSPQAQGAWKGSSRYESWRWWCSSRIKEENNVVPIVRKADPRQIVAEGHSNPHCTEPTWAGIRSPMLWTSFRSLADELI